MLILPHIYHIFKEKDIIQTKRLHFLHPVGDGARFTLDKGKTPDNRLFFVLLRLRSLKYAVPREGEKRHRKIKIYKIKK